MVRFGLMLLLASACGRIGFASLTSGVSGDARVLPDGPNAAANLVFVTSTTTLPGALGSVSGADAICSQLAATAGLPGTYVAFVSTSTTNAIDRLSGARGWIRVDGQPVADMPSDLVTTRTYYPIGLDENGAFSRALPTTATDSTGHFSGQGCSDFTIVDESQCTLGFARATGSEAIDQMYLDGTCDFAEPLYCFGVSNDFALVAPTPLAGLRVFLSSPWQPGGGLASADAQCAADAAAAGWTGTFRAILATGTATAASRFTASAGPIVRADGLRVAPDVATLMAGALETSIDMTANGAIADQVNVWAGGDSPTAAPTSSSEACTSWTSTSANQLAVVGHAAEADVGFFGLSAGGYGNNIACSVALPVYCLEN